MKITAIHAYALDVVSALDITRNVKTASHQICVVEIETDSGITGHGMTSIGPALPIKSAILSIAHPALIGADPLCHEQLWDRLYWLLTPRGQSGIGMHAIAAIDIALWDIKGKAYGQPVWKLLGGARTKCPLYATFGFGFYSEDELEEAAHLWQERGFHRLKMTVGNQALKRRDEPRLLADVLRMRAEYHGCVQPWAEMVNYSSMQTVVLMLIMLASCVSVSKAVILNFLKSR